MRMKLEKKYDYVETSRITKGNLNYVTEKRVEYNRFVDLTKLDHYTISQLIDIAGLDMGKIKGFKKKDYVNYILKSNKIMMKIKEDNRAYQLEQLGI